VRDTVAGGADAELPIDHSYGMIRQRIHHKSHDYFTFRRRSEQERNRFFGATDALLDTDIEASHFGDGVRTAPHSRLLLCYGFLQALYVQQDAVMTLSKAVGVDAWKPDDDPRLREIRDVRDRVRGHPAYRDRTYRPSSAIINSRDVCETHFQGSVYYEDNFEVIRVDVAQYLRDNKERLSNQMLKIEAVMDDKERAFRSSHAIQPFSSCFGSGFLYLRQRLHCLLSDDHRLIQAEDHAARLVEIFSQLQQSLLSRGLEAEAKSPTFDTLCFGLDLLQKLMKRDDKRVDIVDRQMHFDLIYTGVEKYIDMLIREMRDLDEKLSAAV
jgi:hypothetical protein